MWAKIIEIKYYIFLKPRFDMNWILNIILLEVSAFINLSLQFVVSALYAVIFKKKHHQIS